MVFSDLVDRAESSVPDRLLEGYYTGTVHLQSLGVTIPPDARVLEIPSPVPRLAVDVLAESLRLGGFKYRNWQVVDQLRRILQKNDFDSTLRLLIIEALVQGLSYAIVGPDGFGGAKITGHTKKGMALDYDYAGRVNTAVRLYSIQGKRFCAYYVRGQTEYLQYQGSRWVSVERVSTGIGQVPVVPVVNKLRLDDDHQGRSELDEVLLNLSHALSRALTNMGVAEEFLAYPMRAIFSESPEESAKALSSYMGGVIVGETNSKLEQLPGADLSNFTNVVRTLQLLVSASTGIPPSWMGVTTDNPTSAEAMKAAKERLLARAEWRQEIFGDAVEQIARLALGFAGVQGEDLETLEASWLDPAVASLSARNAAILQAYSQGIIGSQTAREVLGLTPEQLERERLADQGRQVVVGEA